MPTLKQLTCCVECELSKTPLQEFQTTYSDGYVETYIAVPELPIPFSIHLQSNGYIAPGLSMFVYIDGVYQCNRNRQNLKMSDENTTKKQTEVNFRVRQKEQMSCVGSFYGKPWKFERVNIVSEPNVVANERAPYDGEFVGTIEVVVLRCLPLVRPVTTLNSAETLINGAQSSSLDSASDSDGLPTALDGAGDPKPKPTPKSRPEPRFQAVGPDGSSENPVSSNWPTERRKKPQETSWGSWGELPAVTKDPSNKSWGDWKESVSAEDEKKMGTVEMTGANTGVYHPPSGKPSDMAASKARSVSGSNVGSISRSEAGSKAGSIAGYRIGSKNNKSWGKWNKPSSAEDGSNKRSGETTAANTGLYNFIDGSSSTKAASKAGSQSCSQADQSNEAPSATGLQTPRALELRGGGTSNCSTRSRRGSAIGSPVFNVGFYNGVGSGVRTPPPLSMGPPPPRDWRAEEAAKKTTTKQGHSPTAQPVFDGWGDLPAIDATDGATAGVEPDPKNKVDSWNAGGSDMPGTWDTANDQKQDDDGWGTSSKKPQENNNYSWGTQNYGISNDAGKESNWDSPDGEAQGNRTWPGAGKASDWGEPAKSDAEETNSNGKADNDGGNWGGNENNEPQPGHDWNGNDTNNAQQDDDWNAGKDEGGGNTQYGGWGIDNLENKKAADDKPAGSKAGSVGKGSVAGSVGKAASVVSKGKSPPSKGPGSATGRMKPGGWSPPPKSRKGTPPQAIQPVITTTHAKPSFSIPTVPKAKAYWSTWGNSNALEEKTIEKELILPAEETLYAIPEEVAVRNSMSHQVRPGRPTTYAHKVSRPKYMDTHENPYAIFVFQYRDKAIIEDMLQTTIDEPRIDDKQRLSSLPKAEIIEELLKEKARSAAGSSASERAATFRSNPRGIPFEPNATALKARLSKLEGSKAATPDMVGAWVDAAQENGNADGTESADGKGTWGKKAQNKGNKNKGGGNWAVNGGSTWGNNKSNDETTTSGAWDNNGNKPTDDTKEGEEKDDNDGDWGGFGQDAGASSWENDEKKDESNGVTTAVGGGGNSWDENPVGGGSGGW